MKMLEKLIRKFRPGNKGRGSDTRYIEWLQKKHRCATGRDANANLETSCSPELAQHLDACIAAANKVVSTLRDTQPPWLLFDMRMRNIERAISRKLKPARRTKKTKARK